MCAFLAGCGRPPADRGEFAKARQLIVDGEFDKGRQALATYVQRNPRAKQASRAGLFLFKAELAKGDLKEATKWCEWTLKEHPHSLEAHKCQYKLGLIALCEGRQEDALRQFGLMADQPNGPLAAEALAMCRFLREYRCVVAQE